MVRMLEYQSERVEELRAKRQAGELRWPQAQGDDGGNDGGAIVEVTLEEAVHRQWHGGKGKGEREREHIWFRQWGFQVFCLGGGGARLV